MTESFSRFEEFELAVLDSLVDQVAVLDADGLIVFVNRAWREFAVSNGASAEVVSSLGLNYLSICHQAVDLPGDDEAATASEGIRAVLAGTLARFELEYPCHGPDEPRWFQMSCTPLAVAPHGVVIIYHNITTTKVAEEALRLSEENLSITLQSIGDAVIATDASGIVTQMNAVAERLTGWSLADASGMPLSQVFRIVNASTRLPSTDPVVLVLERGEVVGLANHTMLIARDGQEYQIADSAAPIHDRGGHIVGVVLVFRDVTETYGVAPKLAETLDLLERTSAMAKIGGWQVDLRTGERLWASELSRILEIDPPVLHPAEHSLADYLPAHSVEVLQRTRALIVDGGLPSELDLSMTTAKGRQIWVRTWGTPVLENGQVVGIHGAIQDVTRQHQAEEELRATEQRLRTIIETEPECVKVVGPAGDLLEMNAAGLAMLEAETIGEARSHGLRQFIVREHRSAFDALHRRVMNGDSGMLQFEVIGLRGSRRWLETHAAPLRDADGTVTQLLGITRDITEQRRSVDDRALLEVKLRQAATMESVGRLAGGVAHDFNNMLGVILGRTEFAMGHVDAAHPVHADLVAIRRAAERSADLTRQLLAFAAQQTVEPDVLDVNDRAAVMILMLRPLIGADVHIDWLPGGNLWPIDIDPSQFDQILSNLCVNARDAITDVGSIRIETKNAMVDVTLCADRPGAVPGEYVVLSVSDTGSGMTPDVLANIFEPFFTTKPAGIGTGLGLATVFGAVAQNRGFIDVSSQLGSGTMFHIYLPRSVGVVEPPQHQPLEVTGGPVPTVRGGETILVVEDEPDILELITEVLTGNGYTVLSAGSPAEAVQLAMVHAGDVRLLISDVIMPGMNGRDLADALTAQGLHIGHLFMSGYPADVIASRGVVDDGVNFIHKPFSIGVLTAAVRETLDAASS